MATNQDPSKFQKVKNLFQGEKHTDLSESEREYENLKIYTGYDRSILMVGITGAGKSSFGNFLLNDKTFAVGFGMISQTEKAHVGECNFNNENVIVIDCPGFCDSKRPLEEIQDEICKVGVMTKDGTDAVAIIVSSLERFSDNHRIVLEQLNGLGGALWDHAFLIFTREAQVIEDFDVKTGKEYIEMVRQDEKCPPVLKEWLDKTKGRYICVESKKNLKNEPYRNEKFSNIFSMIDQIRKDTNNMKYTNSMMKQGQKYWKQVAKSKDTENQVKELKEMTEKLMAKDKEKIEDAKRRQRQLEEQLEELKVSKTREIAALKAHASSVTTGSSSCFSYQTKVMLANNELKEISNIQRGEMVDTPNGPRKVALVSAIKRYKDHLYTLNNLDFSFNKYHPFVVYDATNANVTSFAVIDSNAFIDFMPTMASRRIKSLYDADTKLSGYKHPSTGLTPISIECIRESSEQLPSEYDILYDVILEPNGTGMNQYYAGDRDQLFLVSSEISTYTLEAERQYIPAYATILAVIDKTSQQQIVYTNDVLNTENDVINFFEKEIVQNGVELLSKAALKMAQFQSLHLIRTPLTINEIEKRIQQTLDFFSAPKPIALTTLALIYEYLQTLMTPLHTIIKLGWREFAQTEEKDKLAIGIADIAFISEESFDEPIEIILMTDTERVPYIVEEKGKSSNPRIRSICDSIYIPTNELIDNKLYLIVRQKNSSKILAQKAIRFESDFDYDYRLLKLFSHDNATISEVRVNMDIRMVSDDQMKREIEAKQEWNQAYEIDYAERFASRIVECLVEKVGADS